MPHKSLSPHDLALRAIAAIALTVPACSSSPTGSLSSAADASVPQDAAGGASDAAAAAETAQTSDADQPNDSAAQTDTAQATDTAQNETAEQTDTANAADAAQDVAGGKPLCVATPNDGQCCLHLGEWCLQQFPDDADYEARAQCQYGPNYDASTGCSPWGPPAPPAFAPAAWGLA